MWRFIALLLGAYVIYGISFLFKYIINGQFLNAAILTAFLGFLTWIMIKLWRRPTKKLLSRCSKCGAVKFQSLLYQGMCKKCYKFLGAPDVSVSQNQASNKAVSSASSQKVLLYGNQRQNELIQESLKIIENTTNIETFLSRYEFMLIKIRDTNDESMFSYYAQAYDDYLNDVINRYCHEAYKLKTDRGRKTRIDKLCEILQSHSTNYECIEAANHLAASELLAQKDSPSFSRLFDTT